VVENSPDCWRLFFNARVGQARTGKNWGILAVFVLVAGLAQLLLHPRIMRLIHALFAPVAFLALLSASCSKSSAATEGATSQNAVAAGPVTIIADGNGFTPSEVKVAKGSDGKLRFQRKSDDTCATEVVFPELNIKKPLPLNQVVEITVPTTEAKTYAFTCGMGMFKSAVVVN